MAETEHKAKEGNEKFPKKLDGKKKMYLIGGLAAIAVLVFFFVNKSSGNASNPNSVGGTPNNSGIDPSTLASELAGMNAGLQGPSGPAGPAGPAGKNGRPGKRGPRGKPPIQHKHPHKHKPKQPHHVPPTRGRHGNITHHAAAVKQHNNRIVPHIAQGSRPAIRHG